VNNIFMFAFSVSSILRLLETGYRKGYCRWWDTVTRSLQCPLCLR